MQQGSYKLIHQGLGAIPLANHFIEEINLHKLLNDFCKHPRYSDAILLLVKNVMIERHALYAIHEWSSWYDPSLIQGGSITDDTVARALDRLFEADRASLLTRIILNIAKKYDLDLSEIHQDTTSIKMSGAYIKQKSKAVQLKRGHSKDHRPDLKQLIYALSVTRDGAIPVHFKAYDGNRTDDTLHWDTWQTLRGILGRSDFLYVADSKLCVARTLIDIDRNQGRFITMLPRTRHELKEFKNKLLTSEVRWEKVYTKVSSRKLKKVDSYETALGLYQMKEGFRIHWFRSSEKKRRDLEEREEKILTALDHLRELSHVSNKKSPKTEKKFRKKVEDILDKFGAKLWIHTDITLEKVEEFKQKKRGPATQDTTYKKVVRLVPRISYRRNLDGIAQSEVMDGIFPLATNTDLKPVEVIKSYKYQPALEKRHSMLKSILQVSPVFLKKNNRIEALMFVYFIAQTVSAIIERQLRTAMIQNGKSTIQVLPEERPSKNPTTEQVFRLFEHQARRLLYSEKKQIQTFTEPLTPVQKEILDLLKISHKIYS